MASAKSIAIERRRAWRRFMAFVDEHQQPDVIFRGVSDNRFTLVPKIGRVKGLYQLVEEKIIFTNFRRRARQFLATAGYSDWEMLALAQHHGLPTRLLDWTTNPLVAAYFAVASPPANTTACIVAALAPPLIETATHPDPFAIKSVFAYIPAAVAPRIVSQRGLFTIHPDPTAAWVPTPPPTTMKSPMFDIEPRFRSYFQRRLFQLAIESSSIKADLDGISETLAWQYDNRVAVSGFNY